MARPRARRGEEAWPVAMPHDGVVPSDAGTAKVRGGRGVITASAMRHFHAKGFHATTMRDIAAGADITVASIYHHFDSKQVILQEIMVSSLSDSLATTRDAVLGAGGSATEQLRALVAAWVGFHIGRRPEAMIGASELRSLDAGGRRLVFTLRQEQARLFYGVIERGVAEGDFATAYPRECAKGIISMGVAVSTWYEEDGPLRREDVVERFVDLALGTARAREPDGPAPRGPGSGSAGA